MRNNLVIGSSSQISKYMPDDYIKISSRNIPIKGIINKKYERIFLCFGEQRTCNSNLEKQFIDINVDYTLELINSLKNYCNHIIVYATSELWNNIDGPIDLNMEYNYIETPYIKSKHLLCKEILDNKNLYHNTHIIYPFNFNSIYRKYDSLFGKIFHALLNKEKVEIGNIDFNRDMIHTSKIAEISCLCNTHMIIGSGILINVLKFVKDIFNSIHLKLDEYLIINNDIYTAKFDKREFYCGIKYSSYNELLDLTIQDIKNFYAN